MKKSFKFKSNYIIGSILGLIGIGLPFAIWGINLSITGKRDFPYHMVMLIIGLVYFLIGIIIADIPVIIFKRKTEEYDPVVPEDIIVKSWRLRWPCFIGSVITLLAIGIIGIIYLATGAWPLF